jgi:hypothetical protein
MQPPAVPAPLPLPTTTEPVVPLPTSVSRAEIQRYVLSLAFLFVIYYLVPVVRAKLAVREARLLKEAAEREAKLRQEAEELKKQAAAPASDKPKEGPSAQG